MSFDIDNRSFLSLILSRSTKPIFLNSAKNGFTFLQLALTRYSFTD